MYLYHKDGQIKLISDRPVVMKGLSEVSVGIGRHSPQQIIRDFVIHNNKLVAKGQKIDKTKLKIAMVGVWKIPCGIATYTEFLVEALREAGHEVMIFAEHDLKAESDPSVIRCWKRGQNLSKLVSEIKKYDPDTIFIQHEYGIFPDARKWTSFISQIQNYNHHVVLHSVYKHKDKSVCETICKSIIVHSDIAKEVLIEKGIESTIYVIPHGCIEVEDTSRLWNIYKSPHTVLQFGFGFEYKGWDISLEAISILKEKYPDIFYLILFSESPFVQEIHDSQYQKVVELIEQKGLAENVSIVRGFQSDVSLSNFLRTVRIAIFPYTAHPDHVVYGSSGAARFSLANGTPTIVSRVPLFYDLAGVLPRVDTAEELAAEIDALFSSNITYRKQVEKQQAFVKKNNWKNAAQKYLSIV
jgi:glycosyltransferase involved in cell wall biosynthesis